MGNIQQVQEDHVVAELCCHHACTWWGTKLMCKLGSNSEMLIRLMQLCLQLGSQSSEKCKFCTGHCPHHMPGDSQAFSSRQLLHLALYCRVNDCTYLLS